MAALWGLVFLSAISGAFSCCIVLCPFNQPTTVVVDFGGVEIGNGKTASQEYQTTSSIDISLLGVAALLDVQEFLEDNTNLTDSQIPFLLNDAHPSVIESTLIEETSATPSEAAILASIIFNLRSSNLSERSIDFVDPRVANNTYRLRERLPRPLSGAAATMGPPSPHCKEHRVTLCGGGIYKSAKRGFRHVSNKCWEWDTEQKCWIKVGRMPVRRAGPGWTVSQETGELIITGGFVKRKKVTDKMFTTRDGREFREIGRLPSPRGGHCAVPLAGGQVFVGGGVEESGELLSDALIFTPNSDEGHWISLPDIPNNDTCPLEISRCHKAHIGSELWSLCCNVYREQCCQADTDDPCRCSHAYEETRSSRNLNRGASGRKDFSCGRTINPMNNHEEVIVTGGRSGSSEVLKNTQILDTVTQTWRDGPTIPIDVVRRSTVHAGDDFILVGASDNGESAPMLRWDSGNSEWIQLETESKKAFGAPVLLDGERQPQGQGFDACDCCKFAPTDGQRPEFCKRVKVDCSKCMRRG